MSQRPGGAVPQQQQNSRHQVPSPSFWDRMVKMGQQQQQLDNAPNCVQRQMNEFGGPAANMRFGGAQPAGPNAEMMNPLGLPCSSALSIDPMMSSASIVSASAGSYLFQTPSGSTICQLGGNASVAMDPSMCSPASSASGSQPRLVHLSGNANDSGVSSLSGGFGPPPLPPGYHPQNFSPGAETEELEPIPRDRCNTWPLRHAMGLDGAAGNSQTSPLIHDRIPEEESMYEEEEEEGDGGETHLQHHHRRHEEGGVGCDGTLAGAGLMSDMMESPGSGVGCQDTFPNELSPLRSDSAIGDSSSRTDSPPSAAKKSTTRRNAWGNMSYADLITQAILNSPEKRLTLSQVYEWMVQNVPYFRDKGDSNSSAGWKNSIRHNLSLHSRFMRIQNEGAGKSSWWVINPDAKPGRNPRRRANTMEAATKAAIDKKRRGARKRVETLVQQKGGPAGTCSSSMASVLSPHQDLFPGDECDAMGPSGNVPGPTGGPNFDTFRPRAQSTLSVTGTASRLSPTLESSGFDDFHFPSWMDEQTTVPGPQQQNGPLGGAPLLNTQVTDLLDRTDQMRLEVEQKQRMLNGGIKMELGGGPPVPLPPPPPSSSSPLMVPKSEADVVDIKQEQQLPPPPSYQELSAVRRPAQMQTNPLLRQLGMAAGPNGQMKLAGPNITSAPVTSIFNNHSVMSSASSPSMLANAGQYSPAWMSAATGVPGPQLSLGQQFVMANPNGTGGLPVDLENVNAMSVDQTLLGDLDMDAVLRGVEMAHGGQFDLP